MAEIVLFAPLLGALIAGFLWRQIGEAAAAWVATLLLFLAALLSWVIFFTLPQEIQSIEILRFIESGNLSVNWGIRLDRLTAIMLIVITTVSALVHLYSQGYMVHDDNFEADESYRPRFFAYLSFFTFAMLMLVTADNLVQLFFGWEGVGVASYLLIGFYFRKNSANAAAMKAFVVNRVGDLGLYLAMMALFLLTGSLTFEGIFVAAPQLAETQTTFLWREWNAADLIGILLFIGAMGKSAQLFLHTWLPDAMEGPTPVSALIHAATMVTAGVFLLCRMSPVFEFAENARDFIIFIGASTAFYAATVGLVQNDIKRVIAYSTCSQLGFMFVAAGVGAYNVAMFHLFTHAFFKAMLFLGAGSVIHAMHHEQDMRAYGGLRHKLPVTFWMMLIGTLAITGVGIPYTIFGFAGFFSKDAIIESAFAGAGSYAFILLCVSSILTSLYSWRLIFMTFFGAARAGHHGFEAHENAHESPRIMLAPMMVLALGAVFAGVLWNGSFFGHADQVGHFFAIPLEDHHGHAAFAGAPGEGALYFGAENHILEEAHAVPAWVKFAPFVAMLIGLSLAYLFYIRKTALPQRIAEVNDVLYRFLLNRWYFDEIYDLLLVRPARWLGRVFWKGGDGAVIDGSINGLATGVIPRLTRALSKAQSGYLFHYAFAMVLGIAVLITWMTIGGGK